MYNVLFNYFGPLSSLTS